MRNDTKILETVVTDAGVYGSRLLHAIYEKYLGHASRLSENAGKPLILYSNNFALYIESCDYYIILS